MSTVTARGLTDLLQMIGNGTTEKAVVLSAMPNRGGFDVESTENFTHRYRSLANECKTE